MTKFNYIAKIKVDSSHEGDEMMDRAKFMKKYFKKKIKGAQDFDAYAQEDYEKALIRARSILGLKESDTNELNPLVVSLPEAFFKGSNVLFKMSKKNDHIRYNQARVTVFLFGEHQLFYYTALIDHERGAFSDDYTVEIPYGSIVSIETNSIRFYERGTNHHYIDFQLYLVNDHAITVRLKDVVVDRKELQAGVSIPEDTQTVLQNMMRLFRAKRGL